MYLGDDMERLILVLKNPIEVSGQEKVQEISLTRISSAVLFDQYKDYIRDNRLCLNDFDQHTQEKLMIKIFDYESNSLTMLVDPEFLEDKQKYRDLMFNATRVARKIKKQEHQESDLMNSILEMNNYYNDYIKEDTEKHR